MKKGVQPNVRYGYNTEHVVDTVFNFFGSLGSIAFGYCGHNVVLEIQSTIPSTQQTPSKIPMWRGVVVSYIIVAACYFPVGLIGYHIFGNKVHDNILVELDNPKWLIIMANLFLVIHLIGSYQVTNNFLHFSLKRKK